MFVPLRGFLRVKTRFLKSHQQRTVAETEGLSSRAPPQVLITTDYSEMPTAPQLPHGPLLSSPAMGVTHVRLLREPPA